MRLVCVTERSGAVGFAPVRSNTPYTIRRLPLVQHDSYTLGSAHLGNIECGNRISLRKH